MTESDDIDYCAKCGDAEFDEKGNETHADEEEYNHEFEPEEQGPTLQDVKDGLDVLDKGIDVWNKLKNKPDQVSLDPNKFKDPPPIDKVPDLEIAEHPDVKAEKRHKETIKWAKIAIIVGVIALGIGMWWTQYVTETNQNDIPESISDSENFVIIETNYGPINFNVNSTSKNDSNPNLCINKKMGVSAEIPNPFWDCKVNLEEDRELFVMVRTTGEIVWLSVVDIDSLRNFSVEEIIQKLKSDHDETQKTQSTITYQKILEIDKRVHWELEHNSKNFTSGKAYHVNLLWVDNQKVYLLEQTAEPSDFITEEIKEEMKQILESLRFT